MDRGRRLHYGHFYAEIPLPSDDTRPLLLIHGNCQAEALRVLLGHPASPVRTVRMPPVHELAEDDLPYLYRLLGQTQLLVSQPVRSGYRGLPIGTGDLLPRVRAKREPVIVPVMRWPALQPAQVIVRTTVEEPVPVVPYHDIRTMARAAGTGVPTVNAAGVRAVRELGIDQLRERQARHGTLPVDDLFVAAGRDACQVLNHPGNPVLRGVAQRMVEALGESWEVPEPGRVLLDEVHAPLEQVVIDALDLTGTATTFWRVNGREIENEDVQAAQLAWYERHPGSAQAGLARHIDVRAALQA